MEGPAGEVRFQVLSPELVAQAHAVPVDQSFDESEFQPIQATLGWAKRGKLLSTVEDKDALESRPKPPPAESESPSVALYPAGVPRSDVPEPPGPMPLALASAPPAVVESPRPASAFLSNFLNRIGLPLPGRRLSASDGRAPAVAIGGLSASNSPPSTPGRLTRSLPGPGAGPAPATGEKPERTRSQHRAKVPFENQVELGNPRALDGDAAPSSARAQTPSAAGAWRRGLGRLFDWRLLAAVAAVLLTVCLVLASVGGRKNFGMALASFCCGLASFPLAFCAFFSRRRLAHSNPSPRAASASVQV
eukprot:tig00020961_g16636.t1